jgi:ribosomal protein S16
MLAIRLSRGGAKKRPFYHIVVAEKRRTRDGKYVERLGLFNPIAAGQELRLRLDQERYQYWLSQGAQPTERVVKLAREAEEHQGVVAAKRPSATQVKSPQAEVPEPATAEASAEEAQTAEENTADASTGDANKADEHAAANASEQTP